MGKWLVSLVDTSKLAGWVRSGVAALLGLVAAKWLGGTIFKDVFSPDIINAVAIGVATIAVGIWQQIAKNLDPDYQKPPSG
jgi:hypothetical protein